MMIQQRAQLEQVLTALFLFLKFCRRSSRHQTLFKRKLFTFPFFVL